VTDDATPSDAELATRAAAGDQRAYGELVRRHKDGLLRILRRYAGSPDEAYEAAQEAFIAAWSALARYDPARPFSAWHEAASTPIVAAAIDISSSRAAAAARRICGIIVGVVRLPNVP